MLSKEYGTLSGHGARATHPYQAMQRAQMLHGKFGEHVTLLTDLNSWLKFRLPLLQGKFYHMLNTSTKAIKRVVIYTALLIRKCIAIQPYSYQLDFSAAGFSESSWDTRIPNTNAQKGALMPKRLIPLIATSNATIAPIW